MATWLGGRKRSIWSSSQCRGDRGLLSMNSRLPEVSLEGWTCMDLHTAKSKREAWKAIRGRHSQCLTGGSWSPGLQPNGKSWKGHGCAQLSGWRQKHPEALQLLRLHLSLSCRYCYFLCVARCGKGQQALL